jgi:peptide/nickel transport system substrate-binding protein
MNSNHKASRSPVSRRWPILIVLAALLALASCNGDGPATPQTPSPDPAGTPPVDEPEPEIGGSLVVALLSEPDSLNFSLTTMFSAHWILSTIDARMIRVRDDNTLEPHLLREVPTLENGGISDDGLTYTIRFLPDLTWSDGEPLDATDFVFTWETIVHPDYPAVQLKGWSLIEDVTVSADQLSAVIRLRTPSADFVSRVLSGGSGDISGFLLPEHVFEDVSPAEIAGHPYGADEHIGAGPFQLVSWEPGEQIVVERNDNYWGEQGAYLDRIVFRFMDAPRDAIAQVTVGELDLAVNLPETALLDAIQTDEASLLVTPRAGAVKTYAFNLNDPSDLTRPHPIFEDPDVRRAIVMGFDRWSVVEMVLFDQTSVAATPLSNTAWDPGTLEPGPYDPDEAARLLDEAGWTVGANGVRSRAGQPLRFTVTTFAGDDPESVLRQRVQQKFVDDMAAIGIDVEVVNYTIEQLLGTADNPGVLARRQFDLVDVPMPDRLTVDHFIERFSGAFIPTPDSPYGDNVMGYNDETVNRNLRLQTSTPDAERRAELLLDVQRQLKDDLPVLLIYDHIEIDLARTYVHGLAPGPVAGLWWNVEEWWISRDEVLT